MLVNIEITTNRSIIGKLVIKVKTVTLKYGEVATDGFICLKGEDRVLPATESAYGI